MPSRDDLDERLLRWRELRAQGNELAAEDLCADRPELSAPLERMIRKWKFIEKALPLDLSDKSTPAGLPKASSSIDQLYEILEKLGEGGMGVVYKARERETGRLVALKKMKQFDPAALDRMRKEVRTLQDVSHSNLVTLFDVHSDGAQWFFTMELVEGRPFPGHLAWSGSDVPSSQTIDRPSYVPGEPIAESPTDEHVPAQKLHHPPRSAGSLDQVRSAFLELTEGILALHNQGVLHRDIKPSNVLITPQRHVKILDFGLVTEVVVNEHSFTQQGMAGTPPYMAPEQANGRAEKASDWYSFGVMLYETLTGQHPFRDTPHAMPWARQGYEPSTVSSLVSGIPDDLSKLCDELLCFNPANRPLGADVRNRIAGSVAERPDVPPGLPPFVGRQRHLSGLASAFADSQQGGTVVVLLHGQSGMGKSALAQQFLEHLSQQSRNLVLRGRCYERESVPYKALDGLVDSLSKFWRRLRREQAAELLPQDVGPLVRVFPALLRVEAVAGAPRRGHESPDPHEQRRRAFAALREVLGRIGDRWPLIVHLDDLQWGDVDSAMMLTDLLMPPDPPRLLLLACFRSEDRLTSPFLCHFLPPTTATAIERREMSVESLSYTEACDLAGHLLTETGAPNTNAAEAIARESTGNPFFIYPLVRAHQACEPVALDQVIWRWIGSLEEDQRRLLEIVAVAGRPLRSNTAIRAAELEDGRKVLIGLQAARLLLMRGGSTEQPEVETYHDRIRETVVAHLTPEVMRKRHCRLAVALVASGRADPDVLAEHFHRSGDLERAGEYYVRAAEQAGQSLAFDRAARLYRLALEVGKLDVEEERRLRTLLGKSLANAGRGAEAAEAYLAAATAAPAAQTLELQYLAGEQFMRAGHLEKGLEVLRSVLGRIGISLPETRRRLLWSMFWANIKLWWRGTKFRERNANQVPADELARIDMCWSIGSILALADTLLGTALHRNHFYLLALAAGEPNRVALALGGLAVGDAITGGANQQRGENLLCQARELAERTGLPYTRAMIESMCGAFALLLGQWKKVGPFTERADELLRKECTGVAWEIGIDNHYRFTALYMRGEWKQLAQDLPPLLKEARERGDLFTATSLQIHSAHIDLADDEPDRARQTIVEAMRLWPQSGFHLQHHHALLGVVEANLYAGRADEAWTTINERWPALQESLLLRLQEIRIIMTHLRARCALAAALAPGAAKNELIQSAGRDARALESERMPYADPMAQLIRAAVAFQTGKHAAAVALLDAATVGFESADMLLYAAATRWQLGKLLGDERGLAFIRNATVFMTTQGIRSPVRLLRIFSPGFPSAE
jgi:serine/threonine protein kinase